MDCPASAHLTTKLNGAGCVDIPALEFAFAFAFAFAFVTNINTKPTIWHRKGKEHHFKFVMCDVFGGMVVEY